MIRSVSVPSLSAITGMTGQASHINIANKSITQHYRGQRLWEGRLGSITRNIVKGPWNIWWQSFTILMIIYTYIIHFLIAYYLEPPNPFLDGTGILGEVLFFLDVFLHLLHLFWPIIRLYMRVYRRSYIMLIYDIISLLPLGIIFKYKSYNKGYKIWLIIGRCLAIGRIYRLFGFFKNLNETMRSTRKKMYVLEHILLVMLALHGGSCLWYSFHKPSSDSLNRLAFVFKIPSKSIKFDNYMTCWYYCTCRLFNTIFGDSFPLHRPEKWLTSLLMITGYVCMRYWFIGGLTWELVLENRRWSIFVEQYHHMIQYLKFRGAPSGLVQQAMLYKQQLWRMKDGILTTRHLKELPVPLQMELIFDINVGHFHDSYLFCDTEESFMRHISLLMRHELYLAGQYIWNQGVVKNGMLFIKRGVLEILSDEDDESPMIAFEKGTVLGEISLFYSIPSKVTVKAATYVELQVLRRTDFMRAMSENPHMLKIIRKKVDFRIRSSKLKQNAITNYDQNDSRLIRTRYRPMKLFKNHLAGIEEEDPTFVDDSHMYYKDENNVSKRKFTTEYLDLYKIASNVTTVEEPRICLRATFPWILEPNTDFTNIFDIAHFCMVLYVCVMSPHLASVLSSDWEKVLSTIVTAGLLLNIYIQLTTAIVKKNVRKETVREIAEEKMATLGFYLDIVSVFPMYIFTDTLDPRGESIATQIAVMFQVLQVWHIWDYLSKWERNFNNNANFLCCMKYCLLILIFCYWSGCILHLTACPKSLCRENTWMALLIYWETKIFVTNDAKHERAMTSAQFFGTSVFTGSGASEISPGPEDLTLVILLLILGAYLSFFYIAKICSIYVLSTQRKLKFKESMRELFYFLSVNHVSEKIKERVKKFFCVQWYYNKSVSSEEIFKDMSSNIQQEILSLEMIETLLCCPLFQECSRDFLQTLASNSRTIVLPDNEVVQHAADIGRDMYILKLGYCNKLNNLGKIETSLGPGSNLGVVEMLYGLPKVYTVVTTTNCILLHIEYTVLVQCWSSFPDVCDPIRQVINDPDIRQQTSKYEEGKPLIGKIDAKTNKIKQEIKESFVIIGGRREKMQYQQKFDKLGIMRYVRYIFLPGCVTPHGIFLKFWCLLRFVLAVYYVVLIPYNIATKHNRLGNSYSWADILLYVDIVLMAYVAYYDERSLLVTHPLLTMTRYLKRAFILDILSVFPFEELLKVVNDHADTDLYRINRILLVFRITGTFSYWESDIMQVNQAVILLKFLPIAMTLVNFATAFIFMNSCEPFVMPKISNLMVNSAVSQYVHTFYWVFQIFMGCGCSPVFFSNSADVWLLMALQITGMLYFAFMFGYIASTRSASSHALLSHNEKTRDLADFLYRENVSLMLTVKTLKYFEYVWKRTHGSDPQKICRSLNSALMEDTLVFMYERALREVPLFGKVERSFIRVITRHLHEMYFLKDDTVVQCKDLQTNIYIIYRGKVDVLSSYNEMITCMGPGGMFGNFTGQPVSLSGVTIYASRKLDLLVLPSQTFFNLVKYYSKIQEPLKKAFEMSKDYILPISMDNADEDSSGDSDLDLLSQDSAFDSRSGSSRYDALGGHYTLSCDQSLSNMSQSKSATSIMTYQSYFNVHNLLKPGTSLYQIFGYLTCIMATANYVMALYELVTLNDCYIIFWAQSIFDIYFYAKVYVSMHQGYLNRHDNLILDPMKCRARYYRHKLWVWSDLLCNFPFELFAFCFPKPLTAVHYFRTNKLLRLKYLVEFYRITSAELTNNLTTLQTAMTAFVVVLLLHTFTCVWLLTLIAISPYNNIRTLKLHLLDDDMPLQLWDYTSSFYVVVAVLTGTGGDEFLVDDIFSKSILAICLICGKMLAATVIATSMQVAYSARYALNTYEKAIWELIDVLKNQGLSRQMYRDILRNGFTKRLFRGHPKHLSFHGSNSYLSNKIDVFVQGYQLMKFWKYVRMLWVTERGRQLPALIAQTPYVLRCDLMSAMFGQHLRNCFIFAETGEPFLRQLSVLLDYSIYFPGNYIIVAGDSEPRMHWVASGKVAVVSVRPDLTETTHEVLGPGDVFGIMQGLNRGVTHCFSYRAENKVGILTLSLDTWINILPYFPDAEKIISERSEILFTQA